MTTAYFVPTAEAAFIAGLPSRSINRIVDEKIVPASLRKTAGHTRVLAPLAAALAQFYVHTEKQLAATFRKEVLRVVMHRVGLHKDKQSILALRADASLDLDWLVRVSRGTASVVQIDLTDFIADATKRTQDARRAEELVRSDPAIMGGVPCFAKSRLPIANVIAALDAGETFAQLQEDYPFLTPEHLTSARVYDTIHPRRGRPRRLGELNPNWKLKQKRVVRSRKA